MDIVTLRTVITVLLLAVFAGIVVWAWSGKQRERFAEAAAIPLEDDEPHARLTAEDRSST